MNTFLFGFIVGYIVSRLVGAVGTVLKRRSMRSADGDPLE